ncbi:ubl carboxyl-terminal hydrolase 18 isoform X2 [Sceloporus undulatus]|uniref:ubl carboxyl-terminal hydrolase 18 isoform X2 n=1 Tax=Sceloporus undulatus TaxID=8520 RepID=UPI001C4CA40D|nr:ubl carboxyl-terminal hydrolase 18 isoform X2 [Sceloporus undulatus]
MGQGFARRKRIKTPKLDEYQTVAAETDEEEEEESREDVREKYNKKLKAICGLADLRNAVGLYNIGLSCCLNSLLQVFFMNRYFTMILRRIKVPFEAAEQKASVPYQMLLLLEEMQRGKQKSVHPLDLAKCLSKHNVRLFVLYDAAQLLLILWNLIKDQITNTDLAESLNLLYTIRLKECIMCQECSCETKKESNMLMLPLPMFDFDSRAFRKLEDSLCSFFAPEQLMKENAFHCEKCDRKTPWLRSMKVTYLPQTLTVHLKRFCCNENYRTQKINSFLSFPQSLDFSQILTPEQYCLDSQEKDDGLYDLFAVVAHSGSANFGHYCAYVWSLTELKWYCFNDSSVCQVSWDDIKCTYGRASVRWGETAYLLVYMKKSCKQL